MSSSSTKMDPQVWGTEETREKAIATLIRYVNEHGRRVQCGYTYNSANGFGLTKVWKLCTDSVEGYRLGLLCIYSNFAKTKESEPQMRSADNVSLREQYAHERGYALRRFPADWQQYGKAAGPIRNRQMAENADGLICFWNGHSPGARNMIRTANRKGLQVRTIIV